MRDGFRWSPDGQSIAYWQFDSTGVGTFTLINDTDTLYPTLTQIPYPKAGTENSAARIGHVPVVPGNQMNMQMPNGLPGSSTIVADMQCPGDTEGTTRTVHMEGQMGAERSTVTMAMNARQVSSARGISGARPLT